MPEDNVKCPMCEDGEIKTKLFSKPFSLPCGFCSGSGEITKEQSDTYEESLRAMLSLDNQTN